MEGVYAQRDGKLTIGTIMTLQVGNMDSIKQPVRCTPVSVMATVLQPAILMRTRSQVMSLDVHLDLLLRTVFVA